MPSANDINYTLFFKPILDLSYIMKAKTCFIWADKSFHPLEHKWSLPCLCKFWKIPMVDELSKKWHRKGITWLDIIICQLHSPVSCQIHFTRRYDQSVRINITRSFSMWRWRNKNFQILSLITSRINHTCNVNCTDWWQLSWGNNCLLESFKPWSKWSFCHSKEQNKGYHVRGH